MNTPSIKTLLKAFPHIDKTTAQAVKLAMVEDQPPPRSWYSQGNKTDRQLEAINILIEGHGVAYAASSRDTCSKAYGIEYINMGDTYAVTVIYDRDKGRFIVATVGDTVERNPRRFAD